MSENNVYGQARIVKVEMPLKRDLQCKYMFEQKREGLFHHIMFDDFKDLTDFASVFNQFIAKENEHN